MLYIDFSAGGKDYKLRLNTRAIVVLEKQLGMNPILVFMNKENKNMPTVEQMVYILHASLSQYHPEISLDDTYEIFDSWLEDGHIINEFPAIITEVYILSGLFGTKEKN